MNPDRKNKEASPASSQSVASSLQASSTPSPWHERNLDINLDSAINARQWVYQ